MALFFHSSLKVLTKIIDEQYSSLSTTAACRRQQPVDDSLSTTACRQQLRVLTMVVTVIDGSVMFSYGYG